jgi:hypothetical protein
MIVCDCIHLNLDIYIYIVIYTKKHYVKDRMARMCWFSWARGNCKYSLTYSHIRDNLESIYHIYILYIYR